MKNFSPAYSSKISIATALAQLGVRAVTMTAVARTKPSDSRSIYRQVNKDQSKSGQTPTNHSWFLQNNTHRLHGAALLIMYHQYRMAHRTLPDAHGIAFTLTLKRYNSMCINGMIVTPERFHLLVSHGFAMNWQNIMSGMPSTFAENNIKLVKCKKCKLPHLAEAHYLNYVCEVCNASAKN